MPSPPPIITHVLANQLFTSVSSGAHLTIQVPYTCTNMQVNSLATKTPIGTTGAPALIWELGSNGTVLSTPDSSLTVSNVTYSGDYLKATVTLPTLVPNTTAVVINTTFEVGLSLVNSQQSGTFSATNTICWNAAYMGSSYSADLDVDVTTLTANTPTVGTCVNYPSSNNASATAGPATLKPVNMQREIKVSVPITISPNNSTNTAVLMVPFALALNFS